MKKKLLIILLLLIICTGCDGNATRTIRKSGFVVSGNKFVCNTLTGVNSMFSDKKQVEKIKFLDQDVAISENGNVYELFFNGLFSNKMNCKKAMSGVKITSMIDNEVLRDVDGKYYYLNSNDNTIKFSEVPVEDDKLAIYNSILGDGHVVKAMVANANINSYYVLRDDGNIYNYVVKLNDNTKRYVVNSKIVHKQSEFDGKIIDFKDYGESSNTYFRTNKSIYRMINTNANECNKFVDVTCKYKLGQDKSLTKIENRIIGYGGNILITDYGKVFTAGF
ncbi:MAG: hypothetical protein IJI43_03530 [Bacilli bacterium]|nr:hypothetical protein [Bacilli bacterium]